MATQRVLLGNIRGPKGETGATGPTGPAGTISVGTVTKGEYGTPPQVTNSGTSTAATFDFVIPEGAPGDTVAALDNLTLDAPTTSSATLPIPAAGERGKVIFGKIIKFCNDIKNLASTSANGLLRALSGNTSQWLRGDGSWQTAQNNLTTTSAGYVLDARQGKVLKDDLDSLNDSLTWKVDRVTPAAGVTLSTNNNYTHFIYNDALKLAEVQLFVTSSSVTEGVIATLPKQVAIVKWGVFAPANATSAPVVLRVQLIGQNVQIINPSNVSINNYYLSIIYQYL